MKRNLKALGSALLAAAALATVAAPTALATYDSEAAITQFEGVQLNVNTIETKVGKIKCAAANFSGAENGALVAPGIFTTKVAVVHPTFANCLMGGLAMKPNTAACNYEFSPTVAAGSSEFLIDCPAGVISFDDGAGLKCEVVIPEQAPGRVSFVNAGAGAGRGFTMKWEVAKLEYSWTAACPESGGKAGVGVAGAIKGEVIFIGEAAGAQVGIWVT